MALHAWGRGEMGILDTIKFLSLAFFSLPISLKALIGLHYGACCVTPQKLMNVSNREGL